MGFAARAIGGAVSAAISPDVIKGIDPSGAPLTSEQIALVTAIAMIAGGGLAGALGQNAAGAATSAENEALNNATAGDHAATAAKNGGFLTALGTLLTGPSQVGNAMVNGFEQLLGMIGQTASPQSPAGDPNAINSAPNQPPTAPGVAVVTPTVIPCGPGLLCPAPTIVSVPGSPGSVPGNAILSSVDGGSGTHTVTSGNNTNTPQNIGDNVQLYPDGSLRTPDGKFASVSGNPAPGTTAASQFADLLRNNGVNVVGEEMVVNGPLGPRRYDAVTQDANGTLHGIEVKSGGASPTIYPNFTNQFVNQFGATGTGRLSGQSVSTATTVYVP